MTAPKAPEAQDAPPPPPMPKPAAMLTAAGLLPLVAGAFVGLPVPVVVVASALAVAGSVWIAFVARRWQIALAALLMTLRTAQMLWSHPTPPPGGTSTLLVLTAFTVLVMGGWWVGRRSAGD